MIESRAPGVRRVLAVAAVTAIALTVWSAVTPSGADAFVLPGVSSCFTTPSVTFP